MGNRHGRTNFLITNEGIFDAGHTDDRGEQIPRRPTAIEEIRKFRFSRLTPTQNTRNSLPLLEKLATAMTAVGQESRADSTIPAGFTYLGQFIDHDLTLDKTSTALGSDITVEELLQGRSPSLDLDSLYGRGPQREPQFYETDRVRLKRGVTAAVDFVGTLQGADADRVRANISKNLTGFDVPRLAAGSTASARRVANIPDIRNDENLIVAQTHSAFIRFHNRFVDELGTQHAPQLAFERARGEVIKHYQWMIRHDFLPRLIDNTVLDAVFGRGRKCFEVERRQTSKAMFSPLVPHAESHGSIPIEFTVAAYRLGHSMVRSQYNWNAVFNDKSVPATLGLIFNFSGTSGTLSPGADFHNPDTGEFEQLPSNWIADWRRLYDFAGEAKRADLAAPEGKPNFARPLDTLLVNPLADLPAGAFGPKVPSNTVQPNHLNLAFRNLVRGRMVSLGSGQQLAELYGVKPLSKEEILQGNGGAKLTVTPDEERELLSNTPLWFYILREAEVRGKGRLGELGSWLIAETFHRSIETSQHSIVRNPHWRPSKGPDGKTFRMVDLLLYAFEGKAELLNPVG